MHAAVAMSEDHKPNKDSERARIENEGGVVIWAGTWRVGGVLAVSRAFGDRPLKKFVIATPEVRQESVSSEDEFLILASDGVWDVVSNKVRPFCCPIIAPLLLVRSSAAGPHGTCMLCVQQGVPCCRVPACNLCVAGGRELAVIISIPRLISSQPSVRDAHSRMVQTVYQFLEACATWQAR